MRWLALALTALCGCQVPGCRTRADTQAELEVLFGGCDEILQGPKCLIDGGTNLDIWVKAARTATVTAVSLRGGRRITRRANRRYVEGGLRLSVPMTPEASALLIEVEERGRWRLDVGPHDPHPDILEAERLRSSDPKVARRFVESRLKSATGTKRARLHRVLSRIEYRDGNLEQALAQNLSAMEVGKGTELLSVVVEAGAAAANIAIRLRRFKRAREVLELSKAASNSFAVGRVIVGIYSARYAHEVGDYRAALRHLQEQDSAVLRVGRPVHRIEWRQERGATLIKSGRAQEALDLAQSEEAEEALSLCHLASYWTNVAWTAHLARSAAAERLLREALKANETSCTSGYRVALASINLAVHLAGEGRVAEAERLIGALSNEGSVQPRIRLAILEVEALNLFSNRRLKASERAFGELARVAADIGSIEGQVKGLLGTGKVLEARGDLSSAVARYEAAEKILDSRVLSVPLASRSRFLGSNTESASRLISGLIALGRKREALDAAHEALAREHVALDRAARVASLTTENRRRWEDAVSRYVAARDSAELMAQSAWERGPDAAAESAMKDIAKAMTTAIDDASLALGGVKTVQPAPPPSGTTRITLFANGADWILFADSSDGLRTVRLADREQVEAEVRRWSHKATRLVLRVPAVASRWDLHAKAIVGDVPIAYRLGVGTASSGASQGALVVVDPRGDLSRNRKQVARSLTALAATTSNVELLSERVSRNQVLAHLSGSRLFVYFGHAAPEFLGAPEAALLLEAGHLSVGDLFSSGGPEQAILLACGSGSSDGLRDLGRAFLLTGSRTVLAATRRVSAEDAALLAEKLSEWFQRNDIVDFPAALAYARERSALSQPSGDWSAFRVYMR